MTAVSKQPQLCDKSSAPSVLKDIQVLVLDCDGVLWRGSETIRNAPEALHKLREQGKRLLFVTNNSSKSRSQYVAKFAGLGIEVEAQEIVSSSYAAAAYLQSVGFGTTLHPGKRVLLLGPEGCELELELAGIPYVTGAQLGLGVLDSPDAMLRLQVDTSIGAVVIGWDPNFSYSSLVYASCCLRELPGCLLVSTNNDHADRIGQGALGCERMMPGTGCLVAAVETAADMQAVNVGKGGNWLFPHLCDVLGLDPSVCCVVGDRLDTDIALGKQGGMLTVLPLTGVTTLEQASSCAASEAPDIIVPSFAALAGLDS